MVRLAGFMGMGMVQNAMGTDAQSLFAMGQQQASQQQAVQQQSQPAQSDNTAAVSQSEKAAGYVNVENPIRENSALNVESLSHSLFLAGLVAAVP